jgi:hypothetical protein
MDLLAYCNINSKTTYYTNTFTVVSWVTWCNIITVGHSMYTNKNALNVSADDRN